MPDRGFTRSLLPRRAAHGGSMAASRGPGNSTWAHVGGQVGALLISPLVKAGTTSQEPYNQFLAAAHDRGPVLCGPPGLRRRQQSRLVAGLAVLRLQAAL